MLGDAYKANNRLLDAERTYKHYRSLVKDDTKELEIAEKRIFECQMAQLFLKRPAKIQIEKLNSAINSGLGNFNVCISGDGRSMVYNKKMKFYDALYYCTRTDGEWSEPKEITVNVGSDGEFHCTGLSPDGKRMLLTSYNHFTGFDIYESVNKDGKWRKVKLLNKSVNSPFIDIDAVYSANGREIYFSSNRTSGFGGFDLYKAPIDEAGNIGNAENLGNSVNTEWDEKSPTFANEGKLLFFSTQRDPSMGGLDFFYSRIGKDGKWGKAFNAGFPLSTVGDDIGFSTQLLGNEGLLARYSEGEASDGDIFNVHFNGLSQFSMVPLRGEVKMQGADQAYNGLNLYFIDETIKDTVGIVMSPEGGKYKVDLYPGDFKLVMKKDSNGMVSKTFTIPAEMIEPDFELVAEYNPETLQQVKVPVITAMDTLLLTDILFDFDKSSISTEQKNVIDNLIKAIKDHKITRIELFGFTDSKGTKAYNQNLSAKRATSVRTYLISKGIAASLISTKGMGDAVLVARNKNTDGSDNPEGRGFNRRVEINMQCSDKNVIIIKRSLVPASLKP